MDRRPQLAVLVSLLLAGSMWFYVESVLIPYQVADAAAAGRPRGILSDLYPRWFGARELLLHHRDPYSPEVTRDIQIGYYGRALDPSRPNDPTDQQGFAYPVFVAFLLAPTIKLPFAAFWPYYKWFLVGLMVAMVWACLKFTQCERSTANVVAAMALTLGSFAAAQGILLGQLTIVVGALVAASLVALADGRMVLAGCLLAVATIKPQLVWPLIAWLLLWAVADWRRRQRFLWGLGLTGLGLELGAEMVLPGWIFRFRAAVEYYRQYTNTMSILEKLTTPLVGTIIDWAILAVVAIVCWRWRKAESGSKEFAVVSSLVLAATVVVVSSIAPYNQILAVPAAMLVFKNWRALWKSDPVVKAAGVVGGAAVLWPWVASVALLMAYPLVGAERVRNFWSVPLFSSLAIPPAILGLCGFYGRRRLGGESSP